MFDGLRTRRTDKRYDRGYDRLVKQVRGLGRAGVSWEDINRVSSAAYKSVVDSEETSFGNYL